MKAPDSCNPKQNIGDRPSRHFTRRCHGTCTPVSNGASYYCPCDANQTPYIASPYDQCPDGCFSSSPYCACSYPPTNMVTNSSTSPPTTTTSPPTTTTSPTTTTALFSAACGQSTHNDLTGSITSQNYPNNYQNYQACNYYINAPSLSTINFTFNGLGLEQTSTCYYDWIEFTCESNSISQPIRYCGFGYRPELSFKPCSRVLLRFISDGSVTNIGFSVSYEIEPIRCQGDCAPVSNGASYYCPCDANHTPYIGPPYDQCPYGCFSSSPYCACSYPSTNIDSNSSTELSTTDTLPPTTSTSFTYPISPDLPFSHTDCGQSTYSDLTGNITSQNFPNYYENYQTCNYYIIASSLSTINFTFNGLGLEQTYNCYYDWIEFTCESNSISQTIKYCGFGYRPVLSFKPCSRVLLRFMTDGSVTNIGFSVSYEIEPIRCQGDCTPVDSGTGYNCPCDANQTPYIAPPYNQCPDGCVSSSPYCACSYPPTNMDSNSSTSEFFTTDSPLDTANQDNDTLPQAGFINCYSCYHSGAPGNLSANLSCEEPFISYDGGSCSGKLCATYAYGSDDYLGITQTCIGGQFYEEYLRLCQENDTSSGYFFYEDQCCYSYTYDLWYSTSCFCADDHCNTKFWQPTIVRRSNDSTPFSWYDEDNSTGSPNASTTALNSTTTRQSNVTTSPRPATLNVGNSSGNVSQSTTTRPSNAITTRPSNATTTRPSNATTTRPSNATTNRPSNATTTRPSNATTTRPSNATTTRPSNATTTRPSNATTIRPSNATTTRPSNATTSPRPATVNAGNVSQSTTTRRSNVTTTRRSA